MPLINIQAYHVTTPSVLDTAKFVTKSANNIGNVYYLNNEFFSFSYTGSNPYYGTTSVTTDGNQGFPRVNTGTNLPSTMYGITRNPTNGRLLMQSTSNGNYGTLPIYKSDDNAVTWQTSDLPSSVTWQGIAVDETGVAIASSSLNNGQTVMTAARSTDNGNTWTPMAGGGATVKYIQRLNMFIMHNGSSGVTYSTDKGVTWYTLSIPSMPNSPNFDIVDTGTQLVATVANATSPFRISTDGINWSIPTFNSNLGSNWYANQSNSAYGNGLFVTVPRGSNAYWCTNDFKSWQTGTFPVVNSSTWTATSVAYGNGQFIFQANYGYMVYNM